MPAAVVIAAIGGAVAVGGAALQYSEARKARKAATKQYAFERQLANNRAAKERRDVIRAGRLARGALVQTAANSGEAGNSSIALGALGSIESQLNRNLSFLDTNQKLANLAGFQALKVSQHSSKASEFGAISALGMQVFGAAGGFGAGGGGKT